MKFRAEWIKNANSTRCMYAVATTQSGLSMGNNSSVQVCCCNYQTRHRSLNKLSFSGRITNRDVPEYVINLVEGELISPKIWLNNKYEDNE